MANYKVAKTDKNRKYKKIDQQPEILIEFEDGYSEQDCNNKCYEYGCSYVSYVYEPRFDQNSNRLHLARNKCKLYNGTVSLSEQIERMDEIVCKTNIKGKTDIKYKITFKDCYYLEG